MAPRTYEDDLRELLRSDFGSGDLREIGTSRAIFDELAKTFPTSGSKIDWARVRGSIERDVDSQPFVDFFDEICDKFKLSGEVFYVGDSATDFALEGTLDVIRRILFQLIDVPQHHYFIGVGFAWCLCLTMEGDMAFGFSTPPALRH